MSKHTSKRFLAAMLAVILVLCALPVLAAEETKTNDTVVLYTNDTHCGVDAGTPEGSMGFANLAALKKELAAQHENVLLVDAGDAIQGEAIGTLSNGGYLIDIMNQVGYDLATFGNHEFDYGMEVAKSLLTKSNAKYLSCNFKDLATGKTVADAYTIKELSGKKVAFIGISTPETFTKSTPAYFQDANGNFIYSFCEGNNGQELYAAVQSTIDTAKAEGAEIVIAIAHTGVDTQSSPWTSYEIIQNTTGINAYIDGHSHSTIAGEKVADKSGKEVVLTSTGTKLQNIGKLTLAADGTITTELVNGYTNVDAETDTFIKSIQAQYEEKLNEVVAKTSVALTVNDPETGKRIVRTRETNLGDLCADAYRANLGTDIAFVNGGGIRANIEAGDITYGQIIAVHPFGNSACSIEVKGQQVLDALELGASASPNESGGFLQVSGLKYTIDPNVPSPVVLDEHKQFVKVEGERRVKDVMIIKADGTCEPIDPEKTYTLASHNYMLKSGGDGYTMFKGSKVLQDEVMIDNQVLITYIRDYLKGVVGEDYANPYGQGRITVLAQSEQPTEPAATEPTTDNPATGVNGITVVAMVMLISAAGIVATVEAKKRDF